VWCVITLAQVPVVHASDGVRSSHAVGRDISGHVAGGRLLQISRASRLYLAQEGDI